MENVIFARRQKQEKKKSTFLLLMGACPGMFIYGMDNVS